MIHEISPGMAADFVRLTKVWEAAVRKTHHFLSEADIQYFKPLVRDQFLGMVTLAVMYDDERNILGFAGVADGKLEMLFVDPAYHGKGTGKRLLHYAISNLGARMVDVNEENEQAVGFYLHLGAQLTGRSEKDGLGKPFPLLHLRLPVVTATF
jgi:putative acetyltransferase